MSNYFLMIGSPGKAHVRGRHTAPPHAGWLEIESFAWVPTAAPSNGRVGAPGVIRQAEVVLTRKTDELSTQLMLHSTNATWFDVIVLDLWDHAAQKSKGKLHFGSALIGAFTTSAHFDTFTINFASLHMSSAAGAQTAATTSAAMQYALGEAAR